MTESYKLRFYYRDGCHLCEQAAALLHRGWPALFDTLEWIDVDSQAEIQAQYGLRIPVLARFDQVLCDLVWQPERLTELFGLPEHPV